MTPRSSSSPKKSSKANQTSQKEGSAKDGPKVVKPQKTIKDYAELIETVARVEYSRLPNHLIDHSELVNIGAIAIHVLLTSNPDTEFNVTYLSTAIKWAIRNELRYRYKWYAMRQTKEETKEGSDTAEDGELGSEELERHQIREAIYETILSVDSLLDSDNPYEIRDESLSPDESTELREMSKVVRESIAKLPERERQVIEARFYKNLKMREIGQAFGISPSRISRIVQSGLDKVKAELQRRGYA